MSIFNSIFKKEKRSEDCLTGICDTTVNSASFSFHNVKSGAALHLSGVYAAVQLISNSIAQLAINIASHKDNKTSYLHSHPLSFVFKRGNISKFSLIKNMLSDMLLYGNGYAYINRASDGTITSLRYLKSQNVNIYYNEQTDTLYYTCSLISKSKILPADIIHIYKDSYDGVRGQGILSYAQRTVDSCNYTENATSEYWQSGLHKFGILHAKSPMTPAQSKDAMKLITNYSDYGSTKNIAFMPFDLEFQAMSNNGKDSQMVETRLFNLSEIARFFNISPILLGDLSKSGYSSLEQAQLEFLLHCLQPIISMFEEELNRKLVSTYDNDIYIEFDIDNITKADKSSMATYLKTLKDAGVLTANECREVLGYDRLDGCDDLVIPYTDIQQNTINE